jgi:parallel beta-helix repeat protein
VNKIGSLLLLSLLLGMSIVCSSVNSTPVYLTELPSTSSGLISLTTHDPITITRNSDFSSQGWPGNGSQQAPYIIEALEIVTQGTCISIANCDVHFIIRNCTLLSPVTGVGTGIYFSNVTNGLVENCTIFYHNYGIRFYIVNWLEIVNNTIAHNFSNGLYLDFTSGVEIRDNRIYGNTGYGVYVGSYALFSDIYGNMIGFNQVANARNNGLYNEWDNGVNTGNVWSDYSGTGVYSISGMGVDHYPLGFVSRPADVQYVVGAIVPAITWDVRLPNPDSYTILWDGVTIIQNSLNASLEHLSKAIGGLAAGTYNLTLVAMDGSGYSIVDTVIITVTEESGTTTTAVTTISTTSTTTTATSTTSSITTSLLPDYLLMIVGIAIGAVSVVVVFLIVTTRKK